MPATTSVLPPLQGRFHLDGCTEGPPKLPCNRLGIHRRRFLPFSLIGVFIDELGVDLEGRHTNISRSGNIKPIHRLITHNFPIGKHRLHIVRL